MSFYSALSSVASTPGDGMGAGSGSDTEATRMVAVPVSALAWPVRASSGGDGRSALVVAGAEPIAAGALVAWCKVVVVAPALLRRDGVARRSACTRRDVRDDHVLLDGSGSGTSG